MNKRNRYRDRAHREIVLEALSVAGANSGAIFLQHPLSLGTIPFWETEECITLAGVDSDNGLLFDVQNRIIRYRDLSLLLLLKIHRLIVKKKQYEFKKD